MRGTEMRRALFHARIVPRALISLSSVRLMRLLHALPFPVFLVFHVSLFPCNPRPMRPIPHVRPAPRETCRFLAPIRLHRRGISRSLVPGTRIAGLAPRALLLVSAHTLLYWARRVDMLVGSLSGGALGGHGRYDGIVALGPLPIRLLHGLPDDAGRRGGPGLDVYHLCTPRRACVARLMVKISFRILGWGSQPELYNRHVRRPISSLP